jgi:SAM-dependent methyltransferase
MALKLLKESQKESQMRRHHRLKPAYLPSGPFAEKTSDKPGPLLALISLVYCAFFISWPRAAVAVSSSLSASSSRASLGACVKALNPELAAEAATEELDELVQNHNARQPADNYRQNNRRDRNDYLRLLGSAFAAEEQKLKVSSVYVDSGAGQGRAARQIGIATGARVVMINPQDYSGFFDGIYRLINDPDKRRLQSENTQVIRSAESLYPKGLVTESGLIIEMASLEFTFDLLGLKLPLALQFRLRPQVLGESEYRRLITDSIYRLIGGEELRGIQQTYEVGLSEEILPRYANRVQLLTDVYAAFYYAPNRLEVLRSYFEALQEGGKAFIFLGANIGGSVGRFDYKTKSIEAYGGDKVSWLGSGLQTTLMEWLCFHYPTVFQIEKNAAGTGYVLQISKAPGERFPPLEGRLRVVGLSFYQFEGGGFVVPKLEFKEVELQ